MKNLRQKIRQILFEFQNVPHKEVGIDTEQLKAFLDAEGIFGIESELTSILEGVPDENAKFELESYLQFKNIDRNVEDLSGDEMLHYYLDSKNLLSYKEQINSFLLFY